MTAARLALAVIAVMALATDAVARQQSWYDVEVVVFRQWEAGGPDAESWPPSPPLPDAPNGVRGLGAPQSGLHGFSRLAPAALQLGGIRNRLASSSDYEVITHFGWRQPGLGEDEAPAVALPIDWNPPATADNPFLEVPPGTHLFGSLRVYRSRYLHVQVDLRYVRSGWNPSMAPADRAEGGMPMAPPDSGASSAGPPAEKPPGPTIYSFVQNRRMRSGELHYIDHPVLGMIVQVRRAPQ